jgi:hypothetical protein
VDSERWQRIEQLFHAALELAPEQRGSYLTEACEDDAELRERVARLLDQSSETLRLATQTLTTTERSEAGSAARSPAGTVSGLGRPRLLRTGQP